MQTGSDATKRHQGEPWRLNLDVLLLITAYAHPSDLLSFACTCKRFRELLTDRSSTLIWKTARSKFEGLPDCPADLTEQEYTDLAFCARCYGCGKYASTVFWEMRRRYCPDCRVERLSRLPSCPRIIQDKYVLGMEHLTIGNETPFWVDKEHMESFMDEYERSSDKKQLLSDRQERLVAIRNHARKCEIWQRSIEFPLRQKRDRSIFERLKQLGYEPEVAFVGRHAIRESRKFLFNTSKPLTDKEWDRIWPEWLEIMNNFRLRRLERTVFQSRRHSLVEEYDAYVTDPSQATLSFELLPHVADVARFPPFGDIIRAPEGTQMDDELFQSALAQLPKLVDEWRKSLDAELAELVQIPSHLSFDDDAGGQNIASRRKTGSQAFQAPTYKLRLACALFRGGSHGLFTHPEVFSTSMCRHEYPRQGEDDSEQRTGSIRERFGIEYVKEAPYVIHACGLDPNVAIVEDMDRRDARLKCLSCKNSTFYNWREATWHACSCHKSSQACWQLVSDNSEEMAHIRAAELANKMEVRPYSSRCLLCRPRVGDEKLHNRITYHLMNHHNIKEWDVKKGVHFMSVAKVEHCSVDKVKKQGEEGFKFVVYRNRLVPGFRPW